MAPTAPRWWVVVGASFFMDSQDLERALMVIYLRRRGVRAYKNAVLVDSLIKLFASLGCSLDLKGRDL